MALPSDAVPLNEAFAPVADSVSSGIPTMLAENVAFTACHASESLKKKAASSELIVPCRPAALAVPAPAPANTVPLVSPTV